MRCYSGMDENRFVSQLKKQDIIYDYTFYFKIDNDERASLIIGEYPYNIEEGNICSKTNIKKGKVLTYYEELWGLSFTTVTFGTSAYNHPRSALFNIEKGVIIGTSEFDNDVKWKFFDKYIKQGICFVNTSPSHKYYYCNNDKNSQKKIKYEEFQGFICRKRRSDAIFSLL